MKRSILDPSIVDVIWERKWKHNGAKLHQNLDKIAAFTCRDKSEIHFLPFEISKQDIVDVIRSFEQQKIKI